MINESVRFIFKFLRMNYATQGIRRKNCNTNIMQRTVQSAVEKKNGIQNTGIVNLQDNQFLPRQVFLHNCSSYPSRQRGNIMLHTPHRAQYSSSTVQLLRAAVMLSLNALYSSVEFNMNKRFGYVVYGMMSLQSSGAGAHFSSLEPSHKLHRTDIDCTNPKVVHEFNILHGKTGIII